MSWSAMRYQGKVTRPGIGRKGNRRRRSVRASKCGRRQSLTTFIEPESLSQIFGANSIHRILRICLRLQRMKSRNISGGKPKKFQRKHVAGRDYHHLTPRCRKGESYYGEGWRNLLLIRRSRHAAWHKVFGVRTLEEVITVLTLCANLDLGLWCILRYARSHSHDEQPTRRRAKRSHRKLVHT